MRLRIARFGLALALFASGAFAPRAARADDIDPAQPAFVDHYVAAIVAHDGENLKKLMHPASLACVSETNRDYFDFVSNQDFRNASALRGGYKLTSFAPLEAETATMSEMGGLLRNPAPPTHQFQIDTPFDANNRSLTLMRLAAQSDGAWFIVTGCPTEPGLAFFRERIAAGAEQQARARALAENLHDPLLSEIRALLLQHKRIDAINRYGAASGVDATAATKVIDALESKD
jgi:hypothetical protein